MGYRILLASETVSVGDYRCGGHDSRTDEQARGAEVVFVRQGLFRIESARGAALADPSRAILLLPGERYRVSHPGPCADRSLVVALADAALSDLVANLAPGRADAGAPAFSVLTTSCDRHLFLAQRRLSAGLERNGDALAAEERALALVAPLVAAAAEPPAVAPRDDERVAAVQALLAARFAESLSLSAIGAAVGLSAFRIARLFRAVTGSTIHAHRLELRLRAAVERLAEGERDLTELALDLGFADHSHFSYSFRRRFGMAPSRFRAEARAA